MDDLLTTHSPTVAGIVCNAGSGLRCLRGLAFLLVASAGVLITGQLKAQAQVPHEDCQEKDEWARTCSATPDCNQDLICIRDQGASTGTCRVPCPVTEGDDAGGPNPKLCAYGEACVPGEELGGRETRYCAPVPFTMDLNLLDSCIYHFVEGLEPVGAADDNVCSLAYSLSRMLERDGTSGFSIYDLDRCILDFLAQEPEHPCADGSCLYCTSDETCGEGAFCNPELNRCERECGRIVDRVEEESKALERICAGRMKVCNEGRGRCEDFVLGGEACGSFEDCPRGADCIEGVCELVPAQCEVNRDCPNGAYCFLGECQPRCFRSLECPDSNWFCSEDNKCERSPSPNQPAGFEPGRYSVLFGLQSVSIDGVNNRQELPLLIMDTDSGRAVFGDSNILFGYRLQVTYGRKQDPLCVGDLRRPELTDGQRADCVISPREEFLVLENPFGTVYGDGRQGLGILLGTQPAQRLSTGRYQATIRAVFSNGSSTTMTVIYDKPSPNGRYRGPLEVGVDDPRANLLAITEASLGLRIYRDQERTWDQVLDENHLIDLEGGAFDGREFQDITFGYLVEGAIYGNETLVFNNPDAVTDAQNEVAVRGLYSPQYRKMRLISVVDIAADDVWCRDGTCTLPEADDEQYRVANVFGRDIRRKIEWIGSFDEVTRRFEGIYRETLSGLFPYSVTLQGEFELVQMRQDANISFASPLSAPLLAPGASLSVGFPDRGSLYSAHLTRVEALCSGTTEIDNNLSEARDHFAGKGRFLEYMSDLDASPVFSEVRELGGRVAIALHATGGDVGAAKVSIADLLRDSVKRCTTDPEAPVCVDVDALSCGLALHAKALLAGEPVQDDAAACDRTAPDPCGAGVCVYDPQTAGGRCRTRCDGPSPEACADDEICTAGASVEGYGDHFCKPTFGGWVHRGRLQSELTTGSGETTRIHQAAMFCDRRGLESDDNCDPASSSPNVAALQEYVWFYKNLHETFAFEAGQDVSDAFFQLYRDEYLTGASALDMTAAYHDKIELLKGALAHYDEARAQMFDPVTAQILFDWPMAQFETRGAAWVKQMHSVLNDRAESLNELVDLQRRIIRQDMSNDPLFYNHVFQQEYLSQAFLAVLQGHWQGPQFRYAGQGPQALMKADQILRRVAKVNNPLGLRPNRTYFENGWNSGVQSNVELFRLRATEELVALIGSDGTGGLIAYSKEAVRQALATKYQLIDDLDALKDQLDDELLRLCGEDMPLPQGCADLAGLDRELQKSCVGPNCPVTFQCEDERCDRVARLFTDTLDNTLEEVACRADTPLHRIYKNPPEQEVSHGNLGGFLTEDDLESRLCVRGQVGSLLQDRASLELSRQDTLRQANDLLRQLAIKADLMAKIGGEYADLDAFLVGHEAAMTVIEGAFAKAGAAFGATEAAKFGEDCITIAGAGAAGDNCIAKKLFATTVLALAESARAEASGLYAVSKLAADILKTMKLNGFEETSQVNAIKSEMDSLTSQIESLIGQYQMILQQMQSVDARTADALAVAQYRWNSYSDEVQDVAERITGQDSRWALLRNSAAMKAQQTFRALLSDLYKLVQAVSYRYDLPEGEAAALRNRVYQVVTAGQVQAFLEDIDCRLTQFAGANGLDPFWDDPRDSTVFVLPLRKQLFPTLTDIVDPDTGAVLTADEQFHRIITSPPYLRTLVANGIPEQRIVIPFATWMDVRADSLVGQPALVNRNTCNQVLVGDATRESVAINFEVWNSRTDLQGKHVVHTWLGRGAIDHMRSCSERYPVSQAPIVHPHTFGNAYHDSDVPLPNLETRFEACTGQHSVLTSTDANAIQNLTCWRNAFRERTFGSPDWVLEIDALGPLEENWWILHAPADEATPVIRDIELAFRYTDRAMGSATFDCR